ncbi:DNA polymerase III subunit gamma/tau [Thermosulfurimonas sp. F29]|uniref:DNA polymerase III subunit gamma/tau n=1 Tax=Thermosulfurimonas sp. F29 TaxID=2867247 RepID=UPI001C836EB1|nr:DNA polymerase III subunit gamma/tau [Thermosulfurimonas sp. F29]MBX6422738.1 DNA polymerase III subunit gamma/tau [Thermosulfurimonas sp. F29]
MGYLVLARKYRPQRFVEVVGQPHVVRTLQNALRKGRLAHALLFSGIRGVGKTTVARIVAKALNCEADDPGEPCNVCSPCREIAEGRSLDVIEIDAASNRGIDEIRELRENLKFMPARGRAKVYIIDEAHMLTREAANALLKSLEEPPPHVYFILATTEPHRLPVTILSRCQRYDFRRIPVSILIEHLREVARREGAEIDEQALYLIARESEGSLRDALSLLDQALAYGVRTREELIEAFGLAERGLVEALARAIIRRDLAEAFRVSEEAYRQGVDLLYLSENLTELFRHLLACKVSPSGPSEDLSPAETVLLRELSVEVEVEEALLCFQHLLRGTEALKRSPYPHLTFQLTLARLCEMGRLTSLREILRKLEELTERGPIRGIPSPSQSPDRKPDEISWEEVVEEARREKPRLAAWLASLDPPRQEGDRLVLRIPAGTLLAEDDFKEELRGFLTARYRRLVDIEVERDPEKSFREKLVERPEVKETLAIFGGKVAWVKPRERRET